MRPTTSICGRARAISFLMMSIVAGLVPIAATLFLGWMARRTQLVPGPLWPGINKLAYLVLLPALLYVTIAQTSFAGLQAGTFVVVASLSFLSMGLIAVVLKPLLRTDDPSFSSVFQGGIRWNGFVVLALAQTSLMPSQAALVAVAFAPTVPLINVLCVAALSVWGDQGEPVNLRRVLFRIVTNPLIIGCTLGAIASFVPAMRPALVIATGELIGRAALPLILLAIGAGLNFAAIGAKPNLVAVAVLLKLVVAPAVFLGMGLLAGVPGEAVVVLTAIGAAPGAASSYVLAKELGGNADISAGHVTITTLLAFISLPLWISVAVHMTG